MRILILSLFITVAVNLCAQSQYTTTEETVRVPILDLNNQEFVALIDSFLEDEERYPYYKDNLRFNIEVSDSSGTLFAFSSGYESDAFDLYTKCIKNSMGYFLYKTHNFLVISPDGTRLAIPNVIYTSASKELSIEEFNGPNLEAEYEVTPEYFPTIYVYKYMKGSFIRVYTQEYWVPDSK